MTSMGTQRGVGSETKTSIQHEVWQGEDNDDDDDDLEDLDLPE